MKYRTVKNYLEVLKPRETSLLTFIGVCAAVVAGQGQPLLNRLFLAFIAILLGSAGVNGLTNYLDRDVDARMPRTRHRALASRRIEPAKRVLPLLISLVIVGLVLAGYLHPLSFVFALVGVIAALVGRKRATCVFPQGVIASCAPVLIGWFAIKPTFNWELLLLCALVAIWLPLHVWSVMISHREDYINAGLTYFPMSRKTNEAVKVLPPFALALSAAAIALYFIGGFTLLYLTIASLLSLLMLYAAFRLVISSASRDAWRLYKLSAFPYLGLVFLAMSLDIWLR